MQGCLLVLPAQSSRSKTLLLNRVNKANNNSNNNRCFSINSSFNNSYNNSIDTISSSSSSNNSSINNNSSNNIFNNNNLTNKRSFPSMQFSNSNSNMGNNFSVLNILRAQRSNNSKIPGSKYVIGFFGPFFPLVNRF